MKIKPDISQVGTYLLRRHFEGSGTERFSDRNQSGAAVCCALFEIPSLLHLVKASAFRQSVRRATLRRRRTKQQVTCNAVIASFILRETKAI